MAYTNIDDPSAHFKAVKYTGNGTEPRNIDVGFQSDFIWIKDRTVGYHHRMFDSSRGNVGPLYANINSVEDSYNDGPEIDFSSPHSNGFKIIDNPDGTTNSYGVNMNNSEIISWNWKTNGGTTSSNTDGDITSTVQANTTAGFSIMTYAGTTGDVHTIGHGLGVTPDVWIVKQRSNGGSFQDWFFWHKDMAASNVVDNRMLFLNSSAAVATYTGINAVTSSTIRVKSSTTAQNGYNYVAYAFAEKQGYSKFGKYVGNGSTDGPFIYTGFKPAVVINKRTNTGGPWTIFDSARCPNNVNNAKLYPHLYDAEVTTTGDPIDFLSNGYKLRGSGADCNVSGATYIFMAFAENPFTTSTGVPTTAR